MNLFQFMDLHPVASTIIILGGLCTICYVVETFLKAIHGCENSDEDE